MCVAHPSHAFSVRLTVSPDSEVYKTKFLESWSLLSNASKPIIAAVSGYAVRPLLASTPHA